MEDTLRMDAIFAFKNGKNVELDFTWGEATAAGNLKGKLPAELEKDKSAAYQDRVLHKAPPRRHVQLLSLGCVYPNNQWGAQFER